MGSFILPNDSLLYYQSIIKGSFYIILLHINKYQTTSGSAFRMGNIDKKDTRLKCEHKSQK